MVLWVQPDDVPEMGCLVQKWGGMKAEVEVWSRTHFFGPNSTTQIVETWGLFQKFEQLKVIQKLGLPW